MDLEFRFVCRRKTEMWKERDLDWLHWKKRMHSDVFVQYSPPKIDGVIFNFLLHMGKHRVSILSMNASWGMSDNLRMVYIAYTQWFFIVVGWGCSLFHFWKIMMVGRIIYAMHCTFSLCKKNSSIMKLNSRNCCFKWFFETIYCFFQ